MKELKIYDDAEAIEKIAHYRYFNKLTYKEIGAIMNCSEGIVGRAIDKAINLKLIPEYAKGNSLMVNSGKEKRVAKMEAAHDVFLDEMTNGIKIREASLGEIVKAAKTTQEMVRLETGQSTENMAVSGLIKLVEAANEDGEL